METTPEHNFQWLQFREHWLLRPDGIVGDTRRTTWPSFVTSCRHELQSAETDQDTRVRMELQDVSVSKALVVILNEILSNATDRLTHGLRNIKICFDAETGQITVRDDGGGFPVQQYQDTGLWIPTIAYSREKSGTNFDDTKKRSGAGRNGYGGKATAVFSERLTLETADPVAKLSFKQTWRNNLGEAGEPELGKYTKKTGYTQVSFIPDYERFGMDTSSAEDMDTMRTLLWSRANDTVAALTTPTSRVSVTFDGEKIPLKRWQDYCTMFHSPGSDWAFDRTEEVAGGWSLRIGVLPVRSGETPAPGLHAVVNCLRCSKGTHTEWIFRTLQGAVNRFYASGSTKKCDPWTPGELKAGLFVVALLEVPNPSYTSATKEELRLGSKDFSVDWKPSASFVKQLDASGLREQAEERVKAKEASLLKTLGKGAGARGRKQKGRVFLADKYEPATGRSKKEEKTLILTEGDSAKTLAVAGLDGALRELYGIFPLRGKLLNPHTKTSKQISDNAEIKAIIQILGLQPGNEAQRPADLAYQRVLLFTDADVDGAHICGLFVNLMHYMFLHILRAAPRFLQRFATPVVKVWDTRGTELSFLSLSQKRAWEQTLSPQERARWRERYYKGLGTSTSREAKAYFARLEHHVIDLEYVPGSSDELIHTMFAKQEADRRKELLLTRYDPESDVDYTQRSVTIEDYVLKEMLHFSWEDNVRSIPNVVDGFKPGERKVFYTCDSKNIVKDVKVSELGGITSAHSSYHHGETSLQGTIVGMAQDHVGTNNLNLLVPQGQHGSRLTKASEHASARYLFTRLSPIARRLFHPDDTPVLRYLQDDGKVVEPEHYVPVIPMLLVNGSSGIGTGWSTSVPPHNPAQLVQACKHRLRPAVAEHPGPLLPWYEGFKGTISPAGNGRFVARGILEADAEKGTVRVTELPPGLWGDCFLAKLRALAQRDPPLVRDFVPNGTECTVDVAVECDPAQLKGILASDSLHRTFGTEVSISTTNMRAFAPADDGGKSTPRLFASAEEILEIFVPVRLDCYSRRKAQLLAEMDRAILVLRNKMRFVREVISGDLPVLRQTKAALVATLAKRGYDVTGDKAADYQYLLTMHIVSFTTDLAEELAGLLVGKQQQHDLLAETTIEDLWWRDLCDLELGIEESYRERVAQRSGDFAEGIQASQTASKPRKRRPRITVNPKATKRPRKSG